MLKTVVSAFDRGTADGVRHALAAGGFDASRLAIINPYEEPGDTLDSVMRNLPSIHERLYRKRLRHGESLLVARVDDHDVPRLIRHLQSTGGHQIEAFDGALALAARVDFKK